MRLKRQLGHVILMVDKKRRANIVNYGSSRGHRVSCLVIAVNVYALGHAADIGIFIRKALSKFLNRSVDMVAHFDSRTLSNTVTKNSDTAKRRLLIDSFAVEDAYLKRSADTNWVEPRHDIRR